MGGSQCKCKNCKNETNDVFLNDVINNEGYEYLNSEKEKINEHKEEVQEKECKTNVLTKNNTTDQNEGNKTPNNNNEKGISDIVEGEDMNKIQNDKSEEQNEQFINIMYELKEAYIKRLKTYYKRYADKITTYGYWANR